MLTFKVRMLFRWKAFLKIASLFSVLLGPELHALPSHPAELDFIPATAQALENLKIRTTSVPTDKDAREEFKRRIAIFERFLAKQIDPYTGVVTTPSRCKR